MADFSQVLGSLLISLAKARQIADFQSAAIAEQYRRNPLLEGLGVPRIRVPELELEFPIMIDAEVAGKPNKLDDPKTIAGKLASVIDKAAEKTGIALTPVTRQKLLDRTEVDLREITKASGYVEDNLVPKEAVARRAEESVRSVLIASVDPKIEPSQLRDILDAVRQHAVEIAEIDSGRAPTVTVNILTSEVKERSSPQTAARLRIVLREEGLEWNVVRRNDGTTTRNLIPE